MKYTIVVLLLAACACADINVFQSVPSVCVDDVKIAFMDNCDKYGGKGTFDKLLFSFNDIKSFLKTAYDLAKIEHEKKGKAEELDEVYMYCELRSSLLDKIHKMIDLMTICVAEDQRAMIRRFTKVTQSLMNFACNKGGERIASFIAEGGFKCISDKSQQLMKCGSDIIGATFPAIFNNIAKLDITKGDCNDYKKIQSCFVKAMGTCEKNKSSETMDALFNHMYDSSMCAIIA